MSNLILDCTPEDHTVTDKDSYEALSTDVQIVTEAYCMLDGAKVNCLGTKHLDKMPSEGFEIHGAGSRVGAFELKFGGIIGSANVEIEFTRENAWDPTCPVELLKNGIIIESVPDNQGDSNGDRTQTIATVFDDDVLTLREGADGSVCGVHIYGLKIVCNGMK